MVNYIKKLYRNEHKRTKTLMKYIYDRQVPLRRDESERLTILQRLRKCKTIQYRDPPSFPSPSYISEKLKGLAPGPLMSL